MKRNSIIELMELAISLADAELDGRDVAHILLLIVQKAAEACEQRASGNFRRYLP